MSTLIFQTPWQSCIGIDEVGRGCLAGPVMAGAALPKPAFYNSWMFFMLQDSKKLSPAKRSLIAHGLDQGASMRSLHGNNPFLDYGLGIASVAEIDEMGIQKASFLAMQRALDKLPTQRQTVIVDGKTVPPLSHRVLTFVKADAFLPAVQAAAVLAKVARDQMMDVWAKQFPGYGFESHKGYGTADHLKALRQWGPTPLHRHSFRPVRECAQKHVA